MDPRKDQVHQLACRLFGLPEAALAWHRYHRALVLTGADAHHGREADGSYGDGEQSGAREGFLLSAVYGGILGGIGGGLLYRSGAGGSGTSILGRVIQVRTGIPLSQVFLMTDGIIVILMGIVFTWETSLYALLILFLWGMTSDYVLEGPSSVRTVTIVTSDPEPVIASLRGQMGRTVSHWEVTGGYSGERKYMLMCTVYRPQVNMLKRVVVAADPDAFFVIGDAHQAVGGGFTSRRMLSD